jgi:antitoxin component YwqK of YwqJK toxin-antitoxin module
MQIKCFPQISQIGADFDPALNYKVILCTFTINLHFLSMRSKIIAIISLLAVSALASSQNLTDQQGNKQGPWVKKYQNGNTQYEGTFRDNHPVGEFKRYYANKTILSLLIYSTDGTEVDATLYYPNGFIASKGKYINQLKTGQWDFYSASENGYLICRENYSKNLINGLSVKYYHDGTAAEKINYVNGVKEGEWTQYHEDGKLLLKANYNKNMLNGKYEVWYSDGKLQISGAYKNNEREGAWRFFKKTGTERYVLNYIDGVTKDLQADIDASNLIDSLELNKGKIPDPERTEGIR